MVEGHPGVQDIDRVHRALKEFKFYNALSKVSTRVMAGQDQVRPTCISLPLSLSYSIVPNTLPPQQILSSSLFADAVVQFYKPLFDASVAVRPGPVVGCVPNSNSCPNPTFVSPRARSPPSVVTLHQVCTKRGRD